MANFKINLDYLKWILSYAWNLGIQKYRQGSIEAKDEARSYIQFSYSAVEQLKAIKTREISKRQQPEQWESFGIFLDMIEPRMEEANQKLMYLM